jgi:hypothetical protein
MAKFSDTYDRLINFAQVFRAQQKLATELRATIVDDMLTVCERTDLNMDRLAKKVGRSRTWYNMIKWGERTMSAEGMAEIGEFVEDWVQKERKAFARDKKTRENELRIAAIRRERQDAGR